ncbi:unnamed protein product [Musa acuminata subsp. malaccensis]|uniref:(wild Malaysian banana) hypothetical protein n=1 Tax=Musa acuminata subsp. malaccensis TaxID=214687 RepID=A0A804IAV7_MUSAM|nr:PREDICTED: subtilisin-like protease SBT3.5 [Musa acuminata subsp. malaccensis]CAG1849836.1 unnamed protein product [Musa acuminata subsp. malaccensis]
MSSLHYQTKMASQHFLSSICLLLLITLNSFPLEAFADKPSTKLYIVYLGERRHEDPDLVTASHHDLLSSLLGSMEEAMNSIVYSYRHGFSGFAAMLTESLADQIAELPEVISVKPSRSVPIHTTRSWEFLGLNYNQHQPTGLLRQSNFGDGVIIGFVDTGIWPESRSFDDHGYGPVPSRWKGICQTGELFSIHSCNRKIIGARWYAGGIDPSLLAGEYKSPRDSQGHGTHTASTAAGSFVSNVSFHGLGSGTARGGAPRARLAIYKACWVGVGCLDATVLKAIDDAIHDGVDILSLSLGGQLNPYYASIHAAAKGIPVVFAGGNDGPVPQTIANDLPWVITVAASSIDRSFPTALTFGDNQASGQSLFYGSKHDGSIELMDGGSCSAESINCTNVAGKIVLCDDGEPPARAVAADGYLQDVAKRLNEAKAAGVIVARPPLGLLSTCQVLCVNVDRGRRAIILAYVASSSSPVVRVSPASNILGSEVMAPRVAAFSSRGPSVLFPELIKPDITAPGATILAAVRDSYEFLSGTSMACPHVSGVAALLKAVHPHWSPAAIKSALVTTARTTTANGFPIEANGGVRKLADPFDFGGGQIDPNRASDPGLIYDVDPKDYFKYFHCSDDALGSCDLVDHHLYHLNLPSISIPDLKTCVTVFRTVTNVGDTNSTYMAVVKSPSGVKVTVEPSLLQFNCTQKVHTFMVEFTSLQMVQGGFTFGSLTWVDGGKHSVRIPLAVRVIVQDEFSDTS